MSLIDCHAHCLPPTILDALREFAAGSYLGRTLYADEGFSSLEKHLTLMDRFDVDKEVINYGNLLVPAARARKLPMDKVVKMVNDYIAEASRIAPGRFIPAAAVDPLGGEAAMEELDRAVEKLGLFGISLSTNLDGRALDDPVYEPIFERAKAWSMPLWVHPGQVPQAWQQALGLNNRYLNSGVGFLLDDMLCLIKMITANVFDRWWGVKFVFCQLGGFLAVYDGPVRSTVFLRAASLRAGKKTDAGISPAARGRILPSLLRRHAHRRRVGDALRSRLHERRPHRARRRLSDLAAGDRPWLYDTSVG